MWSESRSNPRSARTDRGPKRTRLQPDPSVHRHGSLGTDYPRVVDVNKLLGEGISTTSGCASPRALTRKMHAEGREPSPSDGPLLMPKGGGGGGKRYDFTYWVWPLPPEGKLTFVCEWRARGLGPTAHEVNATAFRSAGASSTSIWSDG